MKTTLLAVRCHRNEVPNKKSVNVGLPVSVFLFVFFTLFRFSAVSQNIGINADGSGPDSSAMLDINVNALAANAKKGLLIPRVSLSGTTDNTTVPSPATSLLVFNTNAGMAGGGVGYWYWDGAKWVALITGTTGGSAWQLPGNAGTNPATDFLGTTDNQDLVLRANNKEVARLITSLNGYMRVYDPINSSGYLQVGASSGIAQFNVGGKFGISGTGNNMRQYVDDGLGANTSITFNNTGAGYLSVDFERDVTLGTSSGYDGMLILKNTANANTITMQSGATSASYTLTLPAAQGGANTFLQNNGTGTLSWAPAGGGSVPAGVIVMYSGVWNFDGAGLGTGSLSGWALCNGNNGTPNLQDKFIYGTTVQAELLTTGGIDSYTLTAAQLPSHTHTISSGGNHTHSISTRGFGSMALSPCDTDLTTDPGGCAMPLTTSSTGAHDHGGVTGAIGSGSSIDNRPAFVKLAYIMKL